MEPAPFLSELAHAPEDGQTFWLTAQDGVRLRIGVFNRDAPKGTVLLFPGRTEYVEKYGTAASYLAAAGYATIVVDWRGQGLADRLIKDPMAGHVHLFSDYQLDVAAVVAAATDLNLPKPWHMLAHSMGGCIGLRALYLGLPVNSVAFSGPMWGIRIAEPLRPVAWSLSWSSKQLGFSHLYAPNTTGDQNYVLKNPFENNKLTRDAEMYQLMIDQTLAEPALGLGGPSLRWLNEALRECRELASLPSPDLPCFNVVGTKEAVVCLPRIRERMANWPGGHLEWIDGGRHEVLFEGPKVRGRIFDQITAFFDAHAESAMPGPAPRVAAGGQGR
ncbi:MAG: alpha/beta fold hydrolase [Roseovarius sp.]